MTEAKRPIRVFLCHASQDKPAVRELYQRLKKESWIDPWLDEEKLTLGQHWTSAIEDALDVADVVVIFLSQNSVQKEGFVQRELNYAWEISLEKPRNVIFLIPFRLDNCEVPRHLRSRQWGDYFGKEKERTYQTLLRSMRLRHEQKLKVEEAERVQKEKLEREREVAEKAAKEKAEKEAAEKARLDAEEDAREKAAKEKAERETAEKAAREKAEREAAEKARLDAEKKARQKAAREKAARETKERKTAEKSKPNGVKLTPVEEKPAGIPQAKPKPTGLRSVQRKSGAKIAFWGIGFVVIILVIGVLAFVNNVNQSSITTPTINPILSVTQNPMATDYAGSLPTEITDGKGEKMVLVPAGEFIMGSNAGESDEQPAHQVYLDGFYMDKYEVTNVSYKRCVDESSCTPPQNISSKSRPLYYDNSEFNDYPVVFVTWDQSVAYCEWRGGSLPTEAQWEKAARGTDGRTYPWGEGGSCIKANFCDGDTVKVGSYEGGVSPYGAYDMVGNVWEWVADWYSETYYKDAPSINPLGPDTGLFRVVRGGGWNNVGNYQRISDRNSRTYTKSIYLGFRCANSVIATTKTEPIETLTPAPENTALSTEITDAKGASMVLVPAGEFTMGSNNGDDNHKPAHQVYLENFYIDKYEVTNLLYKACVKVQACKPPKSESSNSRPNYYGDIQYNDFPVIYVDWIQAKDYCEWRGARLPTEAEWEKAARGTDGRTYPWGEGVNCTLANYDSCVGDTTQVGSYGSGKSIYGIYDLAGNVWEWVGSAYEEYPYIASDGREESNNQSIWMQRGGSWNFGSVEIKATFRGWNYISNSTNRTGFRCAKDANP